MTQLLRRTFLKQSAIAAGAFSPLGTVVLTPRGYARQVSIPDAGALEMQPFLKVAIDAALAAGASYVDCRVTHTKSRGIRGNVQTRSYQAAPLVQDFEDITVGVRSLVAGYWGMSSSALTSREEMVRLARESVSLAKAGRATGARDVVLAERPVVKDGTWTMPVQIDPFTVHPAEIFDRLSGLVVYTGNLPSTGGNALVTFQMQSKEFLASDGCAYAQTTYLSNGQFTIGCTKDGRQGSAPVQSVTAAGVGLELFDEARLRDEIRQTRETLMEDLTLPVKPVDVGRYTTLISAPGVARILSNTIGSATEVDRVLGHEANATGTSYLKDPAEDVGVFKIGNPLLSVTADRTMAGGAATVQWDDEGVAAEAFPLVQQGVVTDFQTNREGAGWMRDVYARTQTPVRSRGCAYAQNAVDPTMVHTANLRMAPASPGASEAELLKQVNNGIFFGQSFPTFDFQQLNGLLIGSACYEIKGGKKAAWLVNAGALFRAPEFWKSVQSIGDAASAHTVGITEAKGQPPQRSFHSVSAVPVIVKELSVIDIQRKA